MTRNILFRLAYDGASFFGWQKTALGASVEESLEKVLTQILQEPVALQAASRTDRGVHADAQYVNFITKKTTSLEAIFKGANALLPSSIRLMAISEVPLSFHPTLHAEKKEYHYRISNGVIQSPQERFYSWHIPYTLDLEKMEMAAQLFIGEHDFSSFCNMRKNLNYKDKIRNIENIQLDIIEDKRLKIQIVGNSFLYKMVRNIVGTLVYIGLGKLEIELLPAILAARSRPLAGITAPAHGLTLAKIYYPIIS